MSTICPKCQTELQSGVKFCPECGQQFATTIEGEVAEGLMRTKADRRDPQDFQPTIIKAARRDPLDLLPTVIVPGDRGTAGTGLTLGGRYELLEELGSGGFAVVHKARDRKLDRIVAVKRLLAEHTASGANADAVQRFLREATLIASLNHRNIVQVYDHDQDAEGCYIVMEYIGGGTLRQWLKQKGKLELNAAVELMRGICQGLAHAHRKNLVHRDIKPANILLQIEEGDTHVPKIVDFGLARGGVESEVSVSGLNMGTAAYMAPEQRRNAKGVNHTADIYAVGKTLYEMLTGESPENVDPEQVPPAMGRVILKCIKTKPEERYFSVEEFWRDLEQAGRGATPVTTPAASLAAANECPSCHAVNEPDAKFCEGCGAGLTRRCPECEQENSVNRQFCRGCGTDVTGFVTVQDVVAKMEKYHTDQRWSRVVKEAESLKVELKLPGKKGQQLRRKQEELTQLARGKLGGIETLRAVIKQALVVEQFEDAVKALQELGQMDPHDEQVRVRLREVAASIEARDRTRALAAAETAGLAGQWSEGCKALNAYIEQHGQSELGKEVAAQLVRFDVLESEQQGFDTALTAAAFDKAALHLQRMVEQGISDAVRDRLERRQAEARNEYARFLAEVGRLRRKAEWKEATHAARKAAEIFSGSAALQKLVRITEDDDQFANAQKMSDNLAANWQWERARTTWDGYLKKAATGSRHRAVAESLFEQVKRAADDVAEMRKHLAEGGLEEAEAVVERVGVRSGAGWSERGTQECAKVRGDYETALDEAKAKLEQRELDGALEQVRRTLQIWKTGAAARAVEQEVTLEVVRRDERIGVATQAENEGKFRQALRGWLEVLELDKQHTATSEAIARIENQIALRRAASRRRIVLAAWVLGLVGVVVVGGVVFLVQRHLKNVTFLTQAEQRLANGDANAAETALGQLKPLPWQGGPICNAQQLVLAGEFIKRGELRSASELLAKVEPPAFLTAKLKTLQSDLARAEQLEADRQAQLEAERKAKAEEARRAIANATKTNPFVNSLGMKFVPVAGTEVLLGVWDVRVRDYRAYASAAGGVGGSWQSPGFTQGDDHPVVNVSWVDAQAFCAWLTQQERQKGTLSERQSYRLPRDGEWSVAVGLIETSSGTPRDKDRWIQYAYPWGGHGLPPSGAGNYKPSVGADTYEFTSPVASFKSNQYGLYDMGGNVWQWCEDWYDSEQKTHPVRGASWQI